MFALLFFGAFLYFSRKNKTTDTSNFKWQTYDKRVDFVTRDGTLIRDDNLRGLRILPLNYVEKNKVYEISSYNFTDKIERTHILFESISEIANVEILPNSIDGSKLWILSYDSLCYYNMQSKKVNKCEYNLYEYDLNSDVMTSKFVFTQSGLTRAAYLLGHDLITNTLKVGFDHQLSENEVNSWSQSLKGEPPLQDHPYFDTEIYSFNANSNSLEIHSQYTQPYWISKGFSSRSMASIMDFGKNGDTYFIGECDELVCNKNTTRKEGLKVLDNNVGYVTDVPIFYYGQDSNARNLEVTADAKNSRVYVATKTFNQQKESYIYMYDSNTGRSFLIGKQPTKYNDDVRGIDVVDGNLAMGSFSGLSVYSNSLDKWNIISTDDGIESNNVEGVYEIDNGGVCLTHQNDGASCLMSPLSQYVRYLNQAN